MLHTIDKIWIRKGLEVLLEVKAFLSKVSHLDIFYFDKVTEIQVDGDSMASKIENGKHTLVIDRRSSSLLDEFINHDEGSICPNFPKLVPGTNCPYACHYCFLAGTYRTCRSFLCAYVMDLEKLKREISILCEKKNTTTVISAGEMSDPVAGDFLGYMPSLVEMFGSLDKAKLLLLTKSGVEEITPILSARHNGNTITAWSITCEEVVRGYETRTESIMNRLAAAKAAQDAGYEVRFRLDPFLLFDGWEQAYCRTIQSIYEIGIRPSRITMGSFRLLGNLGSIIKARFPESDLLKQPLVKGAGKRTRYPDEIREAFYLTAIDCIRKYDKDVPVALCKETVAMHRLFKDVTDASKCNCLL